jgi:hypothetical protein
MNNSPVLICVLGFVLTAGHKVFGKDPSSLTVRCGEWDTKTETEPFKHQANYHFLSFYISREVYLSEEIMVVKPISHVKTS